MSRNFQTQLAIAALEQEIAALRQQAAALCVNACILHDLLLMTCRGIQVDEEAQ